MTSRSEQVCDVNCWNGLQDGPVAKACGGLLELPDCSTVVDEHRGGGPRCFSWGPFCYSEPDVSDDGNEEGATSLTFAGLADRTQSRGASLWRAGCLS